LPAVLAGHFDATGVAGRALATLLAEPPGLAGPRFEPSWIEVRGQGQATRSGTPRWFGAAGRRADLESRVATAVAASERGRRELELARSHLHRASRALDGGQELIDAVAQVATGALATRWADHRQSQLRLEQVTSARVETDARMARVAERVAELEDGIAGLRARFAGEDAAEIERRLERLRHQRGVADDRVVVSEQALAEARHTVAEAARRAASHEVRAGEAAERQVATLAELRSQLVAIGSPLADADDSDLATHVRITQRGDSFRTVEAIRARELEAQRTADAGADELERDGARGVRSLTHAARFGFVYDRVSNRLLDRRDQPIAGVQAELTRTIDEQRTVVNERSRDLMDRLVLGALASQLQGQIYRLEQTLRGINRVLGELRFGPSRYQFRVTPRTDRRELIELVGRLSIVDDASRAEFRGWIEVHQDELRASAPEREVGDAPRLLDYRRWYDYKLHVASSTEAGAELSQHLRRVGSGGEQGVPNYLLVLALAKLMFDAGGAAVRPLLFDEAFYGIDAGRRDQLLRLATELGIQLVVASPDQDGATAAVARATTLFVVKDGAGDVHLAPYHYWNTIRETQAGLFDQRSAEADAVCRVEPGVGSSRASD
jgi:hypothetical protein